MQNKILHTASKLFLSLGFKSVTMDDIAEKMAISKKTIYEYYQNKTALIEASTHYTFDQITQKIDAVCNKECQKSPIKALFDLNKFIQEHINENNAPEYQLQKYYPKIAESLQKKKFTIMTTGISENLEQGIALGLYRKDLNVPIIARFYFVAINALRGSDIFQEGNYKKTELMNTYLHYHIRAIATQKGLKELENYLEKNEE